MAVINSKFLDSFPKLNYDINNVLALSSGSHETVTDIFFRIGIIKNVLNDIVSYHNYDLDDSETPEILAERIYGDSGAGWIIILANQIVDPLFDWPLNNDAFEKMIVGKYSSIENSQTTTHHCVKIISRYNTFHDVTTESRFIIDNTRLTPIMPSVPYSYFTPYTITTHRTADSNVFTSDDEEVPFLTADLNYDDAVQVSRTGSVAFLNDVSTYEVDGKTVIETIRGEAISCYDYELNKNNDKRLIKIIKSEYYDQIIQEFRNMTGLVNVPGTYVRTLI